MDRWLHARQEGTKAPKSGATGTWQHGRALPRTGSGQPADRAGAQRHGAAQDTPASAFVQLKPSSAVSGDWHDDQHTTTTDAATTSRSMCLGRMLATIVLPPPTLQLLTDALVPAPGISAAHYSRNDTKVQNDVIQARLGLVTPAEGCAWPVPRSQAAPRPGVQVRKFG
jgi:hypothetical protein